MQWPVSCLRQLRELVYFLEAGASHLLRDDPKCSRSAGPGSETTGALWLEETPTRVGKPGILKCCDPGLGTRDEGHGDIKLIEKPGGHWPVSQKGQ